MSEVRRWLADRRPEPPEPLRRRLAGIQLGERAPLEALTRAGLAELASARKAPGRVRPSAYHLLAADALVTWACEAALEAPDPEAELTGILRKVAAPGP